MHRELNTKEEMLKRIVYSIYVVSLFFCSVFGLRGLLAWRPGEILAAILLGGVAFTLKRFGMRHLEFKRLAQSFPLGSDADRLSKEERKKVECLLSEFHTASDWVDRQDIRARLEELVEQKPFIWDVYGHEIRAVHPGCPRAAAQHETE